MLKIKVNTLPELEDVDDSYYLFEDLEIYRYIDNGWEKVRRPLTPVKHCPEGMYNWNLLFKEGGRRNPTDYSKKLYSRVWCHNLYAKAFIPNPQNYKRVDYKDGNYHNISIDNLEWVSQTKRGRKNIQKRWDKRRREDGELTDNRRKDFNPTKHSQTF